MKTKPEAGTVTEDSVYLHLEATRPRGRGHWIPDADQNGVVHRFARKEAEKIVFGEWGYANWDAFLDEYDDASVEWLLQTIGKYPSLGRQER